MADGSSSPLKFLDQASKLGDDEVYIEFAVDRFQHFVCVKIILFLAVAAKVTELLSEWTDIDPSIYKSKTLL